MSTIPTVTISELLKVGAHYGHRTMRWNPKMAPYIHSERNGVHIIDLPQTVQAFDKALEVVFNTIKKNGRVLFVATKSQASDIIAEEAKRCGQYYVNHRWLGGMLTNFHTIAGSIKRMVSLESLLDEIASGQNQRFTKKETLGLQRQKEKIERSLGGIRDMGGMPDVLFVIDSNKESLAITEAQKLGIPVIAILDTNSNPDGITYPIPGNDDATRAIQLYCRLVSETVLRGIEESVGASGADMGSMEEPLEVSEDMAMMEEPKKIQTKKEAAKALAASFRPPAEAEAADEAAEAPVKEVQSSVPAKTVEKKPVAAPKAAAKKPAAKAKTPSAKTSK